MDSTTPKDQRVMWAFWIAAVLAAIGALAPLAFSAGAHSRLTGAGIPFGVAAVALVVNALMYQQGRPLATTLYFVSGLAIVYGILAMVAVPLRLAVVGTCPAPPAHCPAGFEQPLTSGEGNALGVATFCGVLAILIGFYGLLMLYRSRGSTARPQPAPWPSQPPAKPSSPPPAITPTTPPAATTAPADNPSPAVDVAKMAPGEDLKELPAPGEEPKELPAPDEPKELPPPA